jgi:hypothetical protein
MNSVIFDAQAYGVLTNHGEFSGTFSGVTVPGYIAIGQSSTFQEGCKGVLTLGLVQEGAREGSRGRYDDRDVINQRRTIKAGGSKRDVIRGRVSN